MNQLKTCNATQKIPERGTERERETTTNPNNNLLRLRRQYASIIKMFVCVGKQLKMNGQKKKRSNKQTATATVTTTAKRHLNDTFCGEKHNKRTKWSHTPAAQHPSNNKWINLKFSLALASKINDKIMLLFLLLLKSLCFLQKDDNYK